jgi:hypothetical protein
VAVPFGHTLDTVPEVIEYFTENPLAGSSMQSKVASRVCKPDKGFAERGREGGGDEQDEKSILRPLT